MITWITQYFLKQIRLQKINFIKYEYDYNILLITEILEILDFLENVFKFLYRPVIRSNK